MAAPEQECRGAERFRAVVGALCLATDLGMGRPLEHGQQGTVIASRPVGVAGA